MDENYLDTGLKSLDFLRSLLNPHGIHITDINRCQRGVFTNTDKSAIETSVISLELHVPVSLTSPSADEGDSNKA